jgi:LPXTG-motif cell wall-anchored protein
MRQSAGKKEGGEAMNGSGGVGFVIDSDTLFLLFAGISVLAGIWLWLRKKGTNG